MATSEIFNEYSGKPVLATFDFMAKGQNLDHLKLKIATIPSYFEIDSMAMRPWYSDSIKTCATVKFMVPIDGKKLEAFLLAEFKEFVHTLRLFVPSQGIAKPLQYSH